MKKRLLSVVLCLCMVVGMLPAIMPTAQAYYATGNWSNGWTMWSQNQSKNQGMRGWGCLVVAKAKMLVASGIASGDPNVFNPDIFYEWELANGHIGSDMYARTYEDPVFYANQQNKTLTMENVVYGNNEAKVWDNIRSGKYTILRDGGRNHYVFVNNEDSLRTNRLRVFDSWSDVTQNIPGTQDLYANSTGYTSYFYCNGIGEVITYIGGGSSTPSQPTPLDIGNDFYAGIYYIKGDTYVEAAGGDGSTYTNVQIGKKGGSFYPSDPRQIWHFKRHDDGSYKIINEYYGWCLDVAGGRAYGECNVETWHEDHAGYPERWFVLPDSEGNFYNLTAALEFPSYNLDIFQGWTDPGTNVQLWNRDNTGNAQRFNIIKLDNYQKPSRPAAPQNIWVDASPYYTSIAWDAVPVKGSYDSRSYHVIVFDSNGSIRIEQKVSSNSCLSGLGLSPGNYQVYVRALNTKYSDVRDNYSSAYTIKNFTVRPSVSITLSARPENGGTVYGGGDVLSGDAVTMGAVANEGFHFVKWENEDGTLFSDDAYISSLVVSESNHWTAVFEPDTPPIPTYTVGVTASTGGSVSGGGTYNSGDSATVTATPSEGYRFVRWEENGSPVDGVGARYTFTVDQDRNLTAIFELKPLPTHTVSVTASPAEGGTVEGGGSYQEGTSVTVSAKANEKYTFKNWTENGNAVSSDLQYTFTIGASRALTAVFEKEPDETPPEPTKYAVAVSADPVSGGTVTGNGNYTEGSSVTVSAAPNSGYQFKCWKENGSEISTSASYTIQNLSEAHTLVAVFEKEPDPVPIYHVAVNTASGGTVTGGGSYVKGSSVTVSATPHSGYQFKCWMKDSVQISTDASYTFEAGVDCTLTAVFEKIVPQVKVFTIAVNASPAEGGEVTGGGSYEEGTPVTVTATPKANYQFKYWTENGKAVDSNTSYVFTADANRTLTAVFERDSVPTPTIAYQVEVNASPADGGSVTGGGNYVSGTDVTVTAVPSSGYRFVKWTEFGEAVEGEATLNFTVTGNRVLTAVFESTAPAPTPTYTVSVNTPNAEFGTVSGGGNYEDGQPVTISATPNSGYQFVEWQLNGRTVSTTASYTFTARADQTFTAIFEEKTVTPSTPKYSITVSATPSTGGTVTGAGTFEKDSSVTVTATASSGYRFVRWTEGGSQVSTDASYTFTVTADRTLLAEFTTTGGSTGNPGGNPGTNPGSSSNTSTSYPWHPATQTLPVKTDKVSSNGTTTAETIASPSASVSNGTAKVTITSAIANEIIKQATENNSTEAIISPKISGSVTKAEVSIPAVTVSQIGSQTNARLTISTSVADVTIPNGGLSSLSSAGGTVTITAEQTGRTVELSVTANGRTVNSVPGGLTLTVPVPDTAPGTVAVLVNADGTREVVRKSVADNGNVAIPLDGSAKLEIVDNSKYFADVPSTSWAADAVAFVSSHELFNGTSPTLFSPDQPMSRGMLAVALHNLEGNPVQVLNNVFADVGSNEWYAQGIVWAASNGIVTGYGSGQFGPNDNITREQLAVMLWRYAGNPAATDKELHFADAYRASDWALEALCWATEHGIINGKGNGILDPGGYATRAETAQMLKNFLEK